MTTTTLTGTTTATQAANWPAPTYDAMKAEMAKLTGEQHARLLGTVKFATTAFDTGKRRACLYWLDIAEELADAMGVPTCAQAIRNARDMAKQ